MGKQEEKPMVERVDIIVRDADGGERLDKIIPATGRFSRVESRKLILKGAVWVDGKRVKTVGRKVYTGQRIVVRGGWNGECDESSAEKQTVKTAAEIRILFMDDDICAIDKPSGISSMATPADDCNVVTAALKRQLGLSRMPVPIHRLDRDTSGVMVLALNKKTVAEFTRLQMEGKVKRCYTALAHGAANPAGGQWTWPLAADPRKPGLRMVDLKRGKRAKTLYRVGDHEEGFSSVFRYFLELITGRTHQIRVHMAYAGVPVVGDPWYGVKGPIVHDNGRKHHLSRMFLHSTLYSIEERNIRIECIPPDPFLFFHADY